MSGQNTGRLMMNLNVYLKQFLPKEIYSPLARAAKIVLLSYRLKRCPVDVTSLLKVIDSKAGMYPIKCPICNYEGMSELYTYGNPPRWDQKCPSCTSNQRNRLLYIALANLQILSESSNILHFGPEQCLETWFRRNYKNYRTADLLRANVDIKIDLEDTRLEGKSVDFIVCSHVLEHVNDRRALTEIYRILTPHGALLAMVPIIEGWDRTYENPSVLDEDGRWLHYGRTDHLRFYGSDFRNRVTSVGFRIAEYTAYGEEAVRYGLLRGEKVFICKKGDGRPSNRLTHPQYLNAEERP